MVLKEVDKFRGFSLIGVIYNFYKEFIWRSLMILTKILLGAVGHFVSSPDSPKDATGVKPAPVLLSTREI
jgi:hypothetical protein